MARAPPSERNQANVKDLFLFFYVAPEQAYEELVRRIGEYRDAYEQYHARNVNMQPDPFRVYKKDPLAAHTVFTWLGEATPFPHLGRKLAAAAIVSPKPLPIPHEAMVRLRKLFPVTYKSQKQKEKETQDTRKHLRKAAKNRSPMNIVEKLRIFQRVGYH